MNVFNLLTSFAESCSGVNTVIISCSDNDNGIWSILITALYIVTAGVITLGVIGVIIAAIQYASARDNASQVAAAKHRIMQIVIGLVSYVMIAAILLFLIPGGFDSISPIAATSITAKEDTITMSVGEIKQLSVKVEPAGASNYNVTWVSSDDSIIEVSKDGKATAKKAGSATVTASAGGDLNTTINITVTASAPTNTANNNRNVTPTESGDAVKPIGPVSHGSTNIACAAGTIDLGVTDEAYLNGRRISARLCEIPNIKSNGGQKTYKSNGHIVVNSRVSGAYYALGQRYSAEHGGELLEATESFRTMERQQYFYDCMNSGTCNDGNQAADPGYSNHQLGLAVDFDKIGGWNTPMSRWFYDNAGDFGFIRNVSSECWHVNVKNEYY